MGIPFRYLIGGKSAEEREMPDMQWGGAVEGGNIRNGKT